MTMAFGVHHDHIKQKGLPNKCIEQPNFIAKAKFRLAKYKNLPYFFSRLQRVRASIK